MDKTHAPDQAGENSSPPLSIPHPWSCEADELFPRLDVSVETGLSSGEAKRRRREQGPNRLRQAKRRSVRKILADQFRNIIILLLLAATALSLAFGEIIEGIAIAAVILINAAIGFVMEWKAIRSMEALQKLGRVETTVRRDGKIQRVPAEQLVCGDIVLVEGGDVVTADVRLLESSKLQANESVLTGESVPVEKQTKALPEDLPLADRSNMLYKGTVLTRGSAEGVVVATGMNTELGRISSLVEEVEAEQAPLQKRLDAFARRLVWVTLIIAALVGVTGVLSGKDAFLIIETSIALAVATVPEGLPIVATIALARGMWRMARRNALVEQLSAVETLGSTNMILTDKTGTLTENRMSLRRVLFENGEVSLEEEPEEQQTPLAGEGQPVAPQKDELLREAFTVGVLCNNASFDPEKENGSVGEPMEVALLRAGAKVGLHREELLERMPEVREVAFDTETKMMATFHRSNDSYYVAVKGAPEAVLDVCAELRTGEEVVPLDKPTRQEWLQHNQQMAEDGLRMLAVARKTLESAEAEPYEDLTFLGLLGLLDPPREKVREAIQACHQAGIRVIMITGDQAATARHVARAVSLLEDNQAEETILSGRDLRGVDSLSAEETERLLQAAIFARTSPQQKLDLITLHQQNGAIVAMIGDGVNDAPALKKADIGVAMGRRGTQVAREAADMILEDDAFSTIVAAIEQGRIIFGNIRKFVLYLLSCNVSEIMVVGLASLANAPLPILPLQILFLNLVTDVFPALALGVGEGEPQMMKKPPRDPQEPILERHHWYTIGGYGLLITLAVLGALAFALILLEMGRQRAVTISFLTLAFAQLWHVFDMRESDSKILRNEITRNRWVWASLVLCIGLLLGALYIPGLSGVLEVTHPGRSGWLLVAGMSLMPMFVAQLVKIALRSRRRGN